jgi:nitrite reductase/ring-hydroxylating ferredoxin subunit
MSSGATLGALAEFADGSLSAVTVDGHALIVARDGEQVHVAVNRCPHLGFSLTRGPGGLRYADGVVQCPWHNSRFNVCTGENLDWASGFAGRAAPKWSRRLIGLGRTPRNLTTVPARVEDGRVVADLDQLR